MSGSGRSDGPELAGSVALVFAGRRVLAWESSDGRLRLPTPGDVAAFLEAAGRPEALILPPPGGTAATGGGGEILAYDLGEGPSPSSGRAHRLRPGDDEPPDGAPPPPEGMSWVGLRRLAAEDTDHRFRIAGAALQRVEWLRHHRFCSRCGAPTAPHDRHAAMACTRCGRMHFPRVSPAVIVLVEQEDRMLLGRSPGWPEGLYSTLAGFVDPGETLEEAVHREIREEVGVEVTDLRYFASQPWPFPHSLMVGFTARWTSGEVKPDPEEIQDARWFGPDDLPPKLPLRASIARALIEDSLARMRGRRS